jgi:hypothetical protein
VFEFQAAAKGGNQQAQIFLSQLIEAGLAQGVPSEAEQLLITAAEKSNTDAMFR